MISEQTCLNCGWADWVIPEYQFDKGTGNCDWKPEGVNVLLPSSLQMTVKPINMIWPEKTCATWKPKTGENA